MDVHYLYFLALRSSASALVRDATLFWRYDILWCCLSPPLRSLRPQLNYQPRMGTVSGLQEQRLRCQNNIVYCVHAPPQRITITRIASADYGMLYQMEGRLCGVQKVIPDVCLIGRWFSFYFIYTMAQSNFLLNFRHGGRH